MSIPPTELSTLVAAFKMQPAEAAIPSNLDGVILHQIARDLRLIELSMTTDDSVEPPLAGPLYIILHMMRSQSERLRGRPQLAMTEERLHYWLQRYMHFVEREVVARAINMPDRRDAERLLAEIETEIIDTQ